MHMGFPMRNIIDENYPQERMSQNIRIFSDSFDIEERDKGKS